MNPENLEFGIYFNYLVNQHPKKVHWELYENGIKNLELIIDKEEQRVLTFLITHPTLIGFIDSGLSFYKPNCILRKRLLLINSIVECETNYTDLYFNKKKQTFILSKIIFQALTSIYYNFGAIILFKVNNWK